MVVGVTEDVKGYNSTRLPSGAVRQAGCSSAAAGRRTKVSVFIINTEPVSSGGERGRDWGWERGEKGQKMKSQGGGSVLVSAP